MGHCVQCGSPVPEGQRTCSMCYGDPGHGHDGYYQQWLEDEELKKISEEISHDPSDYDCGSSMCRNGCTSLLNFNEPCAHPKIEVKSNKEDL